MKDEDLIWSKKDKKTILETRVMSVTEIDSISPDGEKGTYVVMDAPDWCIVIPEIDDDFLMVKQWRHGENKLSIEFPGGVIERDEEPLEAAKRELLEETGYSAGQMTYLGRANPNPAIMSNHVHFFSAKKLTGSGKQMLDEDEYVSFLRIPKSEVIKNIGGELYSHALMMGALLRYLVTEGKC